LAGSAQSPTQLVVEVSKQQLSSQSQRWPSGQTGVQLTSAQAPQVKQQSAPGMARQEGSHCPGGVVDPSPVTELSMGGVEVSVATVLSVTTELSPAALSPAAESTVMDESAGRGPR
jgi:hypothetical protein